MPRVNHTDVTEVLETELPAGSLTAFIEDAHRVVEQRCAPYSADEDALAAVETYLAAHFATAKEPRVSGGRHEGVAFEFEGNGQRYWHRAVLLDPTNRLARPAGYPVYVAD